MIINCQQNVPLRPEACFCTSFDDAKAVGYLLKRGFTYINLTSLEELFVAACLRQLGRGWTLEQWQLENLTYRFWVNGYVQILTCISFRSVFDILLASDQFKSLYFHLILKEKKKRKKAGSSEVQIRSVLHILRITNSLYIAIDLRYYHDLWPCGSRYPEEARDVIEYYKWPYFSPHSFN